MNVDKSIIYGIVGLAVGATLSAFVISNQPSRIASTPTPSPSTNSHSMDAMDSMTMDEMVSMLDGKTGDEFDKAFLSEMIDHHQGAIDMASRAKTSAKHQEIKTMAEEIISAQSREIEMMKQWQTSWGY